MISSVLDEIPEPERRAAEDDPVFSKWFWQLVLADGLVPHAWRGQSMGHHLLWLKEQEVGRAAQEGEKKT